MLRFFLIFLAIFTLFSESFINAEEPVSNKTTYSFNDLVKYALKNNNFIKDAEFNVKIAEAQVNQARSGYYPILDLLAGSITLESSQNFIVPPGTISMDISKMGFPPLGEFDPSKPIVLEEKVKIPLLQQWIHFGALSLTQPLYTGGKITGYNKMADANLKILKSSKEITQDEVILTVIKRYNDAVLTRKILNIAETGIIKLKVFLKFTEQLYKDGSEHVSYIDFLKMQLFVSSVENYIDIFNSKYQLAMLGLKFITGLDEKLEISLEKWDFIIVNINNLFETYIDSAYKNRPEMKQIKNGLIALNANKQVAFSDYIPDIGLVGGAFFDDNSVNFTDGETYYLGIMLKGNLFKGFYDNAKIQEAKINILKLENKRDLLKRGIYAQIKKSYAITKSAELAVNKTEKILVNASKYMDITEKSYKVGLVESNELIQSQVAEVLAKIQYSFALYKQSNEASELYKSAGIIKNLLNN